MKKRSQNDQVIYKLKEERTDEEFEELLNLISFKNEFFFFDLF